MINDHTGEKTWPAKLYRHNLCIKHALYADLVGAMMAIELVFKNGWQKWLDCDSLLVVKVFSSDNIVPWDIRNR